MVSRGHGAAHVIVVGAGVIGLLTALRCARAGAWVTVLEQAGIPNPAGGSYDRHRVLRALHLTDAPATRAAVAAHRDWVDLERLLGGGLYHQAGALTVVDPSEGRAGLTLLAEAGALACYLEPDELAARFGHIRFPAHQAAILEENAGILLADKIVAALAGWLREQASVELRGHCQVVGVDALAPAVTLADGTTVRGDGIVISAGAWSRTLLPGAAGLVLYRQSMLYCQPPPPWSQPWSATPACPALGTCDGAWLVPPVAGTPLKVSAAGACRVVAGLADHRTSRRWRDYLAERCQHLLAGFDESWVMGARDCYYLAWQHDGGSLLAQLGNGLVWIYGACGGSSFKYAPVIARSLARRVTGCYLMERTGLPALDQPVTFPALPDFVGGAT
jgi:sarcosine oxidase